MPDHQAEDPDEHLDLLGEPVEDSVYAREPVPPVERTRRGLLVSLGLAFAAIVLVQLATAFLADGETWRRVSPILSTAFSVVAGGLGFAAGYYFGGRQD